MIELNLPMPPSTNQLYRAAGMSHDGKRRGRIKTERYRTWLRAAGNELVAQKPRPLTGPIWLSIHIGRPDKRRRDISNFIKAIEDLLVEHKVIEDDSLIEDLHVRWSEDVKPRRCQVAVLSTMVMAA